MLAKLPLQGEIIFLYAWGCIKITLCVWDMYYQNILIVKLLSVFHESLLEVEKYFGPLRVNYK
jgi:hypothetical protein